MRGSYSGNTWAFQAHAESSILLPRSIYIHALLSALWEAQIDNTRTRFESKQECFFAPVTELVYVLVLEAKF